MALFITLEAPGTYVIMAIVAIVSITAIYNKKIFAQLLLHPYAIVHKREYYRIITADLVHNDFVHLLLNEVSVYIFCANLEVKLGDLKHGGAQQMIEIFLISGLFSNIIYTIMNRNKFGFSSAGCSGSALGCLFALMILAPTGTVVNIAFFGGIKNLYTGLLYSLLLFFYKWKRKDEIVNHEIHFYGALGGIIAVFIVCPGRLI